MPQKIIYLLPPSEGKNAKPHPQSLPASAGRGENLSFSLKKPCEIAVNATQKDLKCQGSRYEEGIELNTSLCANTQTEVLPAISRYSGVMYTAI